MAYPNSINANCVQIAEQICATMAAIVQEIMQQVRHSPYTNHTDNQLKDQAHPKSDQKMFIGGYTQDEDYLCVSTDDIWPEYHDNSNCDFDAEAGVDLDVTEEESHQRQLQIGQEDDRVIPEVGDHKELLAKIEDTSLIVTQVCVESTHDKVIPVSHSYFSSPSLSVYAAMGTLCANRKELIIANEVFDKSPPRRGYRVVLNLEPPDDYGSIIHETRDSSLQLGPNAADVETQVVTYCVLVPYATLVPFVTPGLRAKQALKPPVGDSIVPELLLKVLEPYIKKGCILDDERVSLYANVVNKGSTLRIASAEALFWLQLPRALNPLLNKIVSKPLQKSPVLISTYEVDGASMLSKITSKGKSTSGEKNALNFVPFRLLAFEQSGIGTHGELFKINDRNRVYNNIKIASVDWVFKGIHAENFSTVYGNMRKTVSGIPKRNKFAAIMGDIVDLAAELGSYVVQVKQLHLEDKVELEGGNDADDELSLVLWLEQVQGHSYLGLFKMVALLLYFQFGGKGPPTYAVDKENSFQEDINQMTAVSKQVNNHLSYYAYSGDMVLQFLPTNYISAPGAAWAKMTSQVVAAYMMVEALNKKGYNGFALFIPLSSELKHMFTLAVLVVIMMMFYSLLEYFATSMGIQMVAAHQVMNQMIKQVGEDGHGELIANALSKFLRIIFDPGRIMLLTTRSSYSVELRHSESSTTRYEATKASEQSLATLPKETDGPWKEDGLNLKPCWPKPVLEEAEQSQGLVTFSLTNGPEYHVSQIADAVVVARYLRATLVVPDIRGRKFGDKRYFEEIYDVEKFIKSLEGVVKVVKYQPDKISTRNLEVVRVPNRVTEGHIAEQIEPIFRAKGNIRLATYFPSVNMKKTEGNINSVACLAIFGALELQPEVQEVVDSMIERLRTLSRKSDGQFIAVDLRVDILEKKGCQGDGATVSKRCYSPHEIAIFLRKMGFNKDTAIYLTQSRWDNSLDALKEFFPKTYTKEGIMPADKKAKFLNSDASEFEKVIDFYISSQSDVFVPAISGLFYANVAGKRIASGKTQILVPANIPASSSTSVADFVSHYVSKKNHLAYSCFC